MTDTSSPVAKVPLGVGRILADSFSILGKNLVKVLIVGFLGAFLGMLASGLVVGFEAALGLADPDPFNVNFLGIALSVIIPMIVYGLVTALLVQLAYDAKLGRPIKLVEYFGPALRVSLLIAVLYFVVVVLLGLVGLVLVGSVAMSGAVSLVSVMTVITIVVALWLYAVFSVVAPAVMIERAGFGAMGRSARLTVNYRWPIVGVLVLLGICFVIFQLVGVGVSSLLVVTSEISPASFILSSIILSLVSGLGYALGGISISLIYARLREIKEGIGVDEIAKVFE